jgi:GxxExxY protein
MTADELSNIIIGCAIEVHKTLGPGMLESSYEECLDYELKKKGLITKRQLPVPVIYKEVKLDCGYRLDLLVEDKVIIEIKSVDKLIPIHQSQLLTYMRFANIKLGLLINFNVRFLKDGLDRLIL